MTRAILAFVRALFRAGAISIAAATSAFAAGCSGHADDALFEAPTDAMADAASDGSPSSPTVPCPNGATAADPSNTSPSNAEPLPIGTVCGTVKPPDVHYYTFTLPGAAEHMSFTFVGSVVVTMKVDGQTLILSPTAAPQIPFVVKKAYDIEVQSLDANAESYTLTLSES